MRELFTNASYSRHVIKSLIQCWWIILRNWRHLAGSRMKVMACCSSFRLLFLWFFLFFCFLSVQPLPVFVFLYFSFSLPVYALFFSADSVFPTFTPSPMFGCFFFSLSSPGFYLCFLPVRILSFIGNTPPPWHWQQPLLKKMAATHSHVQLLERRREAIICL